MAAAPCPSPALRPRLQLRAVPREAGSFGSVIHLAMPPDSPVACPCRYALSPEKQPGVASETRRVWCSLAERLGMFALKVNIAVASAAALSVWR